MIVEAPVLDRENAAATCSGQLGHISPAGPVTAPRRAIGLPSAESKVMPGAAIGCSDLDSGAVTSM
jgi:hypothetical protein